MLEKQGIDKAKTELNIGDGNTKLIDIHNY